MIRGYRSLWLAPLLVAASLVLLTVRGTAFEPVTRTLYFTAVDSKGASITDLTAADMQVKEGGKDREITKLEISKEKMTVAALVEDTLAGESGVHLGLATFFQTVLPDAEIALYDVGLRNTVVTDFTSEGNALVKGINSLVLNPSKNENHIAEGIFDVSKVLMQRKSKRNVILVAAIQTTQLSAMSTDQVLNQLRQSGATMWVALVPGAAPIAGNLSTSADTEGADKVLGDGPKQSGGRNVEIQGSTQGFQKVFQSFADELKNQYEISYTLADGKMDSKVSISTKRKNITLHAPQRIPDK